MAEAPIKRALISVTDKTGIVEFAQTLTKEFGIEVISTGGTAKILEEAGVPVVPIESYTGFPEMMDGRVKTLHPRVHGGLLCRRDNPGHVADAENNGIGMIDLVCVNLYEFEKTVADPSVTLENAIEHIDIGGPSMLRSAAKNNDFVTVVVDPADYGRVLDEMRAHDGATTRASRQQLALKVFKTTAAYDGAIAAYLSGVVEAERSTFPETLLVKATKEQDLRYGENPQQSAAFYKMPGAPAHSLANAQQLQGKPLSYNNLLDTDAAWAAVREFDDPSVIILRILVDLLRRKMLLRHTIEHLLAIQSLRLVELLQLIERFRWSLLSTLQTSISSLLRFLLHQALQKRLLSACQREQIFAYWLRAESIEAASLR